MSCDTCAVTEGLADMLGCRHGSTATEQRFYYAIPGHRETLILDRCPLAWLRDDATWPFLVSAIRARDLASEGNLSAHLPPGEEHTAVFIDAMRMYGSEVGRLSIERMKRDRRRNRG